MEPSDKKVGRNPSLGLLVADGEVIGHREIIVEGARDHRFKRALAKRVPLHITDEGVEDWEGVVDCHLDRNNECGY